MDAARAEELRRRAVKATSLHPGGPGPAGWSLDDIYDEMMTGELEPEDGIFLLDAVIERLTRLAGMTNASVRAKLQRQFDGLREQRDVLAQLYGLEPLPKPSLLSRATRRKR